MPQAQQYRAVRAEGLGLHQGIAGVFPAVATDRDFAALIHDGHLHERGRARALDWVVGLVLGRAMPEITSGHPFAGSQLAKDDPVKLIAPLDRQHAAALLSEVGHIDPGHERLFREGLVFTERRRRISSESKVWQQQFAATRRQHHGDEAGYPAAFDGVFHGDPSLALRLGSSGNYLSVLG